MGLKFTEVGESCPKQNYSKAAPLCTTVVPTTLADEHQQQLERVASKVCNKHTQCISSYREAGVFQLSFAQNILQDGSWL